MKILHVISSLITGGAEKLVLDSAIKYNLKGIQVDVLLLWDNNHDFTKKLVETGLCKVYILNESPNIKDVYSLRNILKIRSIIKDYDIIHAHLFAPQYFVAIANIGINKKLVFTEHSTSNRRIKSRRYYYFQKWCYSRYDNLISITDEIKDIYCKYLNLGNKITVINNGVDLLEILNSKSIERKVIDSSLENTDILLIQVSTLRKEKDHDTIIKSLVYLPENYKLLIVGDGIRKNELMKLTHLLKLDNRVLFLGQRNDVPALLKTSDIVILSSHHEGLSLSSIEGMASGKPFVASAVPGLIDIVSNAGVLFEKENAKQLSEVILELINDKEYYNKIVLKCINRSEDYNIDRMIDKHIDLYNKVFKTIV